VGNLNGSLWIGDELALLGVQDESSSDNAFYRDKRRKGFCIHVSYPFRPKSLRRSQCLWSGDLRNG
jgi:hypothetical protein